MLRTLMFIDDLFLSKVILPVENKLGELVFYVIYKDWKY